MLGVVRCPGSVPRIVRRGRRVSRADEGGDNVQRAALVEREVWSSARGSVGPVGIVHPARKALRPYLCLIKSYDWYTVCASWRGVCVLDVRPERVERARSPGVLPFRDAAPMPRVVKRHDAASLMYSVLIK
jgi:hypothetical protein